MHIPNYIEAMEIRRDSWRMQCGEMPLRGHQRTETIKMLTGTISCRLMLFCHGTVTLWSSRVVLSSSVSKCMNESYKWWYRGVQPDIEKFLRVVPIFRSRTPSAGLVWRPIENFEPLSKSYEFRSRCGAKVVHNLAREDDSTQGTYRRSSIKGVLKER